MSSSKIAHTHKKYHHLGVPTIERFEGEIDIPHLKMTVSDHKNSVFGIQRMRFWPDAPYPELVKTTPHIAFEVENLEESVKGKKIIIQSNSPSKGLTVAFIEVDGVPVELMEYQNEKL